MNTRHLSYCLALAVGLPMAPLANADGLRIGLQGSVAQWDTDWNVQALRQNESMESDFEPSFGVLAQYVFSANEDNGFFVGFEVDAARADAAQRNTFAIGGVPVVVGADVSWNVDVLWLMGYDFGKVSAVLAGGGSYMSAEMVASGSGSTIRDENAHVGWKIVPTVEIDLGKSSALMVRLGVGRYQTKSYNGLLERLGAGGDINVEPRTVDVRVAWVYRVDRLFGGRK